LSCVTETIEVCYLLLNHREKQRKAEKKGDKMCIVRHLDDTFSLPWAHAMHPYNSINSSGENAVFMDVSLLFSAFLCG
jgi:hypothetical protein